jgi:hypothetical protein
MARFRVDLQQTKNVSGSTRQPANEAARVGNARQGVVFLNIFQAPGTAGTIYIDTAADPNLGDGSSSGNYWVQVGSVSTGTTSGTVATPFTITDLGEVIRWRYVAGAASEFSFSLVVFLSDQ